MYGGKNKLYTFFIFWSTKDSEIWGLTMVYFSFFFIFHDMDIQTMAVGVGCGGRMSLACVCGDWSGGGYAFSVAHFKLLDGIWRPQ